MKKHQNSIKEKQGKGLATVKEIQVCCRCLIGVLQVFAGLRALATPATYLQPGRAGQTSVQAQPSDSIDS